MPPACRHATLRPRPIRRRDSRSVASTRDLSLTQCVFLDANTGTVLPKSPIGEAITYASNQWETLKRFLDDGRLGLDNNVSEPSLRAVAVGRKNWIFAGSDAGAERAAVLYSLVVSCRLHEIDPWAYLSDVLPRSGPTPSAGSPSSRPPPLAGTPAGSARC
jgi:hypothetical protein